MSKEIKPVMGVADLMRVRQQIKELQARERDLVSILKDKGVGIYSEDDVLAVVSSQSRQTVNLEGMRSKYPQEVEEFTGMSEFLVVKTMRGGSA